MNLNQVTVPSTNVARSIDFYQRLGLRLIVESIPKYARLECPDGGSTFSVHLADVVPGHSQGNGSRDRAPEIVVYFECEDLDGTVRDLKENGIVFETDPVDQDWLWREAYLRDPDGNLICLYYAGKNRLNPPWRIS